MSPGDCGRALYLFFFLTLSYLITIVQSSGGDLSHLNYEIALSLFVREHAMYEVLLRFMPGLDHMETAFQIK